MKRLALLLGLLLLGSASALGQAPSPIRVSVCGTGAPSSPPGTPATPTIDINGLTCSSATGGGGGTAASYQPGGTYAAPLSVTTTTGNVALPAGQTVTVYNTGTVPAYVRLGVGAGTTATTSNEVIQPGGSAGYTVGSNTFLAAITASGTTTLNVSGGSGLANSTAGATTGGGGAGTPTFTPNGNYSSPLSVTTATGNIALPAGTITVVYNTGTVPAYVKLGVGAGTTATTANDLVPAGGSSAFTVGANTFLAAVTASGSTVLNISGGVGIPAGFSGTVASAGGATTPFQPGVNYSTPLAASTTSTTATLPTGTTVVVYNVGAVTAYVKLGSGSVTATTQNDAIQPGSWMAFAPGSNTLLAAITTAGSTTLNISGGSGLPSGAGGGTAAGGGGVTTDGAGWNAGVSSFTPGGGVYSTTLPNLANGAQGTFALGQNRSLHVIDDNSPQLLAAAQAAAQGFSTQAIPAYADSTTTKLSQDLGGGLRISSWAPGSVYSAPLAVTTTTSNVPLPAGSVVTVDNVGANAAYVNLGVGAGTTATTSQIVIQPSSWKSFAVGANTYIAAITASATTTLNVAGGAGEPAGSGGGGGGGAAGVSQGMATTATPAYTNATASNLSLDLGGGLRQSSYQPNGNYAPLTASSGTSNVALPAGTTVVVSNTGANVGYVNFGVGAGTTATASNIPMQPGSWRSFTVGANTFMAGISPSGTTFTIEGGAGNGAGSGGGGGGGAASNVTLLAGSAIAGKFGIDQTTPGTTNGVVVNSLPALATGSNIAGKFGIDQTTPGTTNGVVVNSLPALSTGTNSVGTFTSNVITPSSVLTLPATTTAYGTSTLIANSATAGSVVVPSFSTTNNKSIISRMKLISNDATGTAWPNVNIYVDLWSSAPTFTNGDRGAYLPATGTANHLGTFSCVMRSVYGDGIYSDCAPTVGTFVVLSLGSPTVFWTLQSITASGVTGASKTMTLIPEIQL